MYKMISVMAIQPSCFPEFLKCNIQSTSVHVHVLTRFISTTFVDYISIQARYTVCPSTPGLFKELGIVEALAVKHASITSS